MAKKLKSHEVARELQDATGLTIKSDKSVDSLYHEMLDYVTDEEKFSDKQFKRLSQEAKKWITVGVEALNSEDAIPSIADVVDNTRGGTTKMAKKAKAKKGKKVSKVAKKAKAPKGNGDRKPGAVHALRAHFQSHPKVDADQLIKWARKNGIKVKDGTIRGWLSNFHKERKPSSSKKKKS